MTESATPSFADAEVQRCPFAHYDRLRGEAPVYFDRSTGICYQRIDGRPVVN